MRTLKELDYRAKTDTLLLGYQLGSAMVEGRKLDVIGSGNIVRFRLEGCPGHVDLRLNDFAANAAEWLLANAAEDAPVGSA